MRLHLEDGRTASLKKRGQNLIDKTYLRCGLCQKELETNRTHEFDEKNMTPGPTLIMKAPGCKQPVKFSTIGSGNTFGATFWTDGKQEAPMLPDEPWLRKSPSEDVLFWSDECEEIGQVDLDFFSGEEGNPEWENLEFAEEPDEADYVAAIRNRIANTEEKLRYIRMRLWWSGNDRIRRKELTRLPQEHIQNLSEFASLLSEEDPNQRLMKAEVLRELSRFDEALRLLEGVFPEDYQHAVQRIRDLAASKESQVVSL